MFKLPCVGGGNLYSLELQIVIKKRSRMYPVLKLLLSALLYSFFTALCTSSSAASAEGRQEASELMRQSLTACGCYDTDVLLKCDFQLVKHTCSWAFVICKRTKSVFYIFVFIHMPSYLGFRLFQNLTLELFQNVSNTSL